MENTNSCFFFITQIKAKFSLNKIFLYMADIYGINLFFIINNFLKMTYELFFNVRETIIPCVSDY